MMIVKNTDTSDYSLETLSEAVNYNEFIYSLMQPYLGTKVLELGAGIGNLTPFFLRGETSVRAIDIDPHLIDLHRQRVRGYAGLSVECVSIQELCGRRDFHAAFDSVVSSNVLEHIPDGTVEEIVRAMHILLRPGGYAVHWVPAFKGIFGSLDEAFGHCRRYSKAEGKRLFESQGFQIHSLSYWNMPGFFGWWFYGRIAKLKSIPKASALRFDRYVLPVLRLIEPHIWRPFGQSLLIIARKSP